MFSFNHEKVFSTNEVTNITCEINKLVLNMIFFYNFSRHKNFSGFLI